MRIEKRYFFTEQDVLHYVSMHMAGGYNKNDEPLEGVISLLKYIAEKVDDPNEGIAPTLEALAVAREG